ncbi:MAG TPA: hypothetical protein DCY00_05830 [Actinobacteria bacterium]|nr:hypothetical protein [Actinomycetota bacterium]
MEQKKVYNHKKITSDYVARDYLDKAEKSIIENLKPFLKDMSMLDMGVGAGRTTKYFLPIVNCYIGADYAPNMIEECRRKFSKRNIFEVVDVRDMRKFADNMFDFVLFSYNGIDSFNEKSRIVALREIKRVLKNKGFFAFSTHNINWEGINDIFRFKTIYRKLIKKSGNGFLKRIFLFFKSFYLLLRLNILNKTLIMASFIKSLQKEGHGILADNSLNGKVRIYYSSTAYQRKQLEESGFFNVKTFSVNGIETCDETELNRGGWIYYLCQLKK